MSYYDHWAQKARDEEYYRAQREMEEQQRRYEQEAEDRRRDEENRRRVSVVAVALCWNFVASSPCVQAVVYAAKQDCCQFVIPIVWHNFICNYIASQLQLPPNQAAERLREDDRRRDEENRANAYEWQRSQAAATTYGTEVRSSSSSFNYSAPTPQYSGYWDGTETTGCCIADLVIVGALVGAALGLVIDIMVSPVFMDAATASQDSSSWTASFNLLSTVWTWTAFVTTASYLSLAIFAIVAITRYNRADSLETFRKVSLSWYTIVGVWCCVVTLLSAMYVSHLHAVVDSNVNVTVSHIFGTCCDPPDEHTYYRYRYAYHGGSQVDPLCADMLGLTNVNFCKRCGWNVCYATPYSNTYWSTVDVLTSRADWMASAFGLMACVCVAGIINSACELCKIHSCCDKP